MFLLKQDFGALSHLKFDLLVVLSEIFELHYLSYSLDKEKCYVHNIFTTFTKQILSGKLLLAIIGGQKCI